MKNLIICCDGTNDQYGQYNTNVIHLIENLLRNDQQIICYNPGVGTFDFFGKPRSNDLGAYLGKAFGYGLQLNLAKIYRFLATYYNSGDRVFLFGFSRGAYTVRELASLLHQCGLLEIGCISLLPYLFKLYFPTKNQILLNGFKQAFCKECIPYFIGVWDTVKSLGYFFGKQFPHNNLYPEIPYAYQALAIDEQRQKFLPSLWSQSTSAQQTVEQVWFSGVHSDIGGGYPERGLSDISLQWMLQKAKHCGLTLTHNWEKRLQPDPYGVLHQSYKHLWKLWRPAHRNIPDNALIHRSVIQRMNKMSDYRPKLPIHYTLVD